MEGVFMRGRTVIFFALLSIGLVFLALTAYRKISPDIESAKQILSEFQTSQINLSSQILDDSEEEVASSGEILRLPANTEVLPPFVVKAFLAAEDISFFQHFGFSPLGIARAAFVNLRNGKIVQGASTITQQLAKLLFLSSERSFSRKMKELIFALCLEQKLSKTEILDLYLTHVYFGKGAYGIEAAAKVYFNKSAKDLTISEAALLAGIPKSPSFYSPLKNAKNAEARRKSILKLMRDASFLTSNEYKAALSAKPKILNHWQRSKMPLSLFREVPKELAKILPSGTLTEGLKVKTTFSPPSQEKLDKLISEIQKMIPNAKASSYELAGVTLRINGAMLAMRGAINEDKVYFNHALQMKRPVGAHAIPVAAELVFRDGANWGSALQYWQPKKNSTPVSIYEALENMDANSMSNVVDQVGVTGFIQTLRRAGIFSKYQDIRAAAGFDQANLVQLARLGLLWVSGGFESPEPHIISKIESFQDEQHFIKKVNQSRRVLPASSARLVLLGLKENSPCSDVVCYYSYDPYAGNLHVMIMESDRVSTFWLGGKNGETLELSPPQLKKMTLNISAIYKNKLKMQVLEKSTVSYMRSNGKRIPFFL
jgi:penicillin-binding protein 1A